MLQLAVFALKEKTLQNPAVMQDVRETERYFKDNGYDAKVMTTADAELCLSGDVPGGSTLFFCDDAVFAEKLAGRDLFVAGFLHEGNQNEPFEGLKYIFSDIEQVEMDSFVKVYQRYAGEPWDVLETARLLVRETTVADVDEFYRIYYDPEIVVYMEGLFENPEDEKRYQKDYIEKVYGFMGFGVWTVIRKSDNRIIGRAGYSVRQGFEDPEIGFLVGKEFQKQGYAHEVCSAILDYGRDVLQFRHVQALVKAENTVSIHLCERLGFVRDKSVRIEENIYGDNYSGTKGMRVFDPANYGDYVRMIKHF